LAAVPQGHLATKSPAPKESAAAKYSYEIVTGVFEE
jgi:hypothetical protein